MIENKLFGIIKGHREHIADHTGRLYSDSEVADLLNKLVDENKELKAENEQLKQDIDNICREIAPTTTTTEVIVKLQSLLFNANDFNNTEN